MSQLWWRVITPPGNISNPTTPIGTPPVWQLMSGSAIPINSASLATLLSTNWATEGGPPYVTLYDLSPFFDPPTPAGVALRMFPSGAGGPSVDRPVDVFGYSSASMRCTDPLLAYFEVESLFGMTQPGDNFGLAPSVFPAQVFTNDPMVGPIAVGTILTGSLNVSLNLITLHYATTDTSGNAATRRGLIIGGISGSPNLALEPVATDPVEVLPGDIWMRSGSAGGSNLFYGDQTASGSRYTARVLSHREGESFAAVVARFATGDRPSGSVLSVNSIVVDQWLSTVNSSQMSGSGWRNESWGGGIYMPNSGTVAIWSSGTLPMDFLVPSGSMYVAQNLSVDSGSIFVNSGSIVVASGSIIISSGSIDLTDPTGVVAISGSLEISGSNAQARLRGADIIAVMVSNINSGSLIPVPRPGTLYINTGSIPSQISLRTSGSWLDFSLTAPTLVDGGTY